MKANTSMLKIDSQKYLHKSRDNRLQCELCTNIKNSTQALQSQKYSLVIEVKFFFQNRNLINKDSKLIETAIQVSLYAFVFF